MDVDFLLYNLKLMLGFIYFILVPGILFQYGFLRKIPRLLSPILGLLLQLYNMVIIWIFYILLGSINVTLMLLLLTLLELASISLSIHKNTFLIIRKDFKNLKSIDKFLIIIVAIYSILITYYSQFANEPHSDGAAYLDLARNIAVKSIFSSNMMFPSYDWRSVIWGTGMHPDIHSIGSFIFALFFIIRDVSLTTAQIALAIQGIFIILLVYEMCKKLFNINIARLAAFIISIHPEFITHIVLVGGPEVPSALFLLFTFYLTMISMESQSIKDKIKYSILGGFALFLSWFAWYFNFYVFFAQIPFVFLLFYKKSRNNVKIIEFLVIIFTLIYFIIDYRIVSSLFYSWLGITPPFAILLLLIFISKISDKVSDALRVLVILILVSLSIFSIYRIVFQFSIQHTIYFKNLELLHDNWIQLIIEKNKEMLLDRLFCLSCIIMYWEMYRDGIEKYLGTLFILLSMLSFFRIKYLKEILLFSTFVLLHASLWILFSQVEAFQARFIFCNFIFYSILIATFLELFIPTRNEFSAKIVIKSGNLIVSIKAKKKTFKFLGFIILLSLLVTSFANLYPEYKKILESWKWSQIYGWVSAINWINNNTSPDSIILTRSASHFAWYTGRHVAYLDIGYTYQPSDVMTERELIKLIKLYKANYLIVDGRTAWLFPYISSLWKNPCEFLGSKIVFNDEKVIIYNVTNIAYGVPRLIHTTILHEVENLEYWYPNIYYGYGTIELDSTNKVNGNFSIKFTQTIAFNKSKSCLFLKFIKPVDLSNFDYMSFYLRVSQKSAIIVALNTDAYNYFLTPKIIVDSLNFTEIKIPLKILKAVGNPCLKSIMRVQLCFVDLLPGETHVSWIDGPVVLEKINYVFNSPG